ncbi:hypothetical protein BDR26DRAFT_866842 [Obelidium mucronatum]|nr:hypothetical protein BDR26DRAFT_866842 [Obelidium mucronatum]
MTLPDVRNSKLEPRYEGPYKIIHRTRQGTLQLLDADGKVLNRKYAPQQLKLVSSDTFFEPTAEVRGIVKHRQEKDGSNTYLVEWKDKNFPNQWVPYSDFKDTAIIMKYHDSINPNSKSFRKNAQKRRRSEQEPNELSEGEGE